jgi:hypothetical protein
MAASLATRASAASSTSSNSGEIDSLTINSIRFDATVSVVTAGSIQFFLEGLGTDGIWYLLYGGTAISAPGALSVSVGPAMPLTAGPPVTQPGLVPDAVRVRWVIVTGPITWSHSLIGDLV